MFGGGCKKKLSLNRLGCLAETATSRTTSPSFPSFILSFHVCSVLLCSPLLYGRTAVCNAEWRRSERGTFWKPAPRWLLVSKLSLPSVRLRGSACIVTPRNSWFSVSSDHYVYMETFKCGLRSCALRAIGCINRKHHLQQQNWYLLLKFDQLK